MNPYELLLCNLAFECKNTTLVGNGKLDVSVFGYPDREVLQFNEELLWDGDEQDVSKGAESHR